MRLALARARLAPVRANVPQRARSSCAAARRDVATSSSSKLGEDTLENDDDGNNGNDDATDATEATDVAAPPARSRFPFVDSGAFVDAEALGEALAALRRARDLPAAAAAAEWLDAAAGDSVARLRAAREAARAFVDARASWTEVPADLMRQMSNALASTAASRGDVGWLDDEAAGTTIDGESAFEEALEGVLARPGSVLATGAEYFYLLVPGLFGSYYPRYYADVEQAFRDRGAQCRISRLVDGEGAVVTNAKALAREIEDIHAETGKRVVIIGHSKGGVDGGAALALHDDRLRKLVRGLIAVQSPFGGSPIATDLLSAPLADPVASLLEILVSAPKGDGARLLEPIRDLTYRERRAFLAAHPIPSHYPVVSFATATKSAAAGLFPSARYIDNRYGEPSDGLVCVRDAQIPRAVCVNVKFENDHADCVFPSRHPSDMVGAHARAQAENLALRQRLGLCDSPRRGPPLPPPVGVSVVAAQRALADALPERLKSSPASVDYHEALVGVLLARPGP